MSTAGARSSKARASLVASSSFGCYAEDLPRLKARIEGSGVKLIDPPPGFASNGFWFRNPENVLIEVKVGPKVSPHQKAESQWTSAPAGTAGAAIRAKWPAVRPRRLSHVLTFTADVDASIKLYERTLRPAPVRPRLRPGGRSCTASMAAIIICWRW